jgi:hypothetical protein
MYPKFNLSRTRIVILTLVCTIVCAGAAFVAFERQPTQKATVRPVGVVDPLELRVAEAGKSLKQETYVSRPEERSTNTYLINPFELTPLLNNGSPTWLTDEKQSDEEHTALNQSLNSPTDRTKASADIPDLKEPVGSASTAIAEEPQRKRDGREENKARGDHPDEAVKFRNMQMQDENGEIPLDGLQKARQQMNVMRAEQQKRARAAGKPDGIEVAGLDPGDWFWLGPGNVGGRIRSIVIHPTKCEQHVGASVRLRRTRIRTALRK